MKSRAVDMELCDIANRQPMTPSQRKVFHAIEQLTDKNGLPPTQQEIADYLGVTNNAVYEQVCRLKRKGYLEDTRFKARAQVIKN